MLTLQNQLIITSIIVIFFITVFFGMKIKSEQEIIIKEKDDKITDITKQYQTESTLTKQQRQQMEQQQQKLQEQQQQLDKYQQELQEERIKIKGGETEQQKLMMQVQQQQYQINSCKSNLQQKTDQYNNCNTQKQLCDQRLQKHWNRLAFGDNLKIGQRLTSIDGRSYLQINNRGQIELVSAYGQAVWYTGTLPQNQITDRLCLGLTSNGMVLYDSNNGPNNYIWRSNNGGVPQFSELVLHNNCNLAIYDDYNRMYWQTATGGRS